jgi:hypothetical protein
MTKFKISETKDLNKLTNWGSPFKTKIYYPGEREPNFMPTLYKKNNQYHLRSYSNVSNTG